MSLACLCGGLELLVLAGLAALLSAVAAFWRRLWARLTGRPVPMHLTCPKCMQVHVDREVWATRPHKTHLCEHCGNLWRPHGYATVGVEACCKAHAT